ncbi:chorismate mutase [Erwinia sp. MMLR14_017]|uniref:chorismate mutase n=1 Tax=Erwinia sp. MMLR14_017 TaxID=3093842 RepID=UPI00298FA257|nr:chorismate mutase [Erwinia sp. MMLR14_017]MDW8844563.1 chorismate mutase [Erwinia sp. MMLR14_017]
MESYDHQAQLAAYRQTIDHLDAALIYILAERFRSTYKIGELKATHNLPEVDKNREELQLARLKRLAQGTSLEPHFIEGLMRFIIDEVVHRHSQIRAK